MSIITDNSTPLPLNSPQNLQMINTVNTNMQSFINSNMLSNVSNLLINNINTKQPILTAATNLLGVGSAITAIDWTKITLNKPTDFQANWNTTVINKPTDFQAHQRYETCTRVHRVHVHTRECSWKFVHSP